MDYIEAAVWKSLEWFLKIRAVLAFFGSTKEKYKPIAGPKAKCTRELLYLMLFFKIKTAKWILNYRSIPYPAPDAKKLLTSAHTVSGLTGRVVGVEESWTDVELKGRWSWRKQREAAPGSRHKALARDPGVACCKVQKSGASLCEEACSWFP